VTVKLLFHSFSPNEKFVLL